MRAILSLGLLALAASAAAQTCPSFTNASNFNGTPISGGTYLWFNANFTAGGIPSTGATILFQNASVSFPLASSIQSTLRTHESPLTPT